MRSGRMLGAVLAAAGAVSAPLGTAAAQSPPLPVPPPPELAAPTAMPRPADPCPPPCPTPCPPPCPTRCVPCPPGPRVRVVVPPPEVVFRPAAAKCDSGCGSAPKAPAMVNFTATYTVPYTTTTMVPVATGGFVGGFSTGGFASGGFAAPGVGGFQVGSPVIGGFGGVAGTGGFAGAGLVPVAAGGFGAATGQAGGFQAGGLTDVEAQLLRSLLGRTLAQDAQGRGASAGFGDTAGGLLGGRDTEARLRQVEAEIRKIKLHLAAEVGEREKLTAAVRELVEAHDQLAAAAQVTYATKQELRASEERARAQVKEAVERIEKRIEAVKEELKGEIKKANKGG